MVSVVSRKTAHYKLTYISNVICINTYKCSEQKNCSFVIQRTFFISTLIYHIFCGEQKNFSLHIYINITVVYIYVVSKKTAHCIARKK